MSTTTHASPSHSIVLLMDPTVGEVPATMGGALVAATPTCVAIGTLSEHDGETTMTLASDDEGEIPSSTPVYETVLDTPSRTVTIGSIRQEVFLQADVWGPKTRVRVWVNDPREPDILTIVLGLF